MPTGHLLQITDLSANINYMCVRDDYHLFGTQRRVPKSGEDVGKGSMVVGFSWLKRITSNTLC